MQSGRGPAHAAMDQLQSANQFDDLPHKWVDVVADYLRGFRNDTTDFNRPQLRSSVRHTYPAFVCGYSALIMAGALCNAYVLAIVARKRLYATDPVYVYVANLAVTGIVECVSVLPISLMVLLVQNWIFGRFLCFFLPMLQVLSSKIIYFINNIIRYRCFPNCSVSLPYTCKNENDRRIPPPAKKKKKYIDT